MASSTEETLSQDLSPFSLSLLPFFPSSSTSPQTVETIGGEKRTGWKVVADKDFSVGSVILKSRPTSWVLHRRKWNKLCHSCCRPPSASPSSSSSSPSLQRCSRCKIARYCSRACQVRDWKQHHSKECKPLFQNKQLIDKTNDSSFSDLVLVGRLFRYLKQGKEEEKKTEKTKKEITSTWENALFLEIPSRNKGKFQNQEVKRERERVERENKELAKEIMKYFELSENQVLGILDSFGANNFSICNEVMACIGSAIFPHGALINHSCKPNTVHITQHTTEGPVQVFQAIREIKKGDEITHCYGGEELPYIPRVTALTSRYNFSCDCPRCKEGKQNKGIDALISSKRPLKEQQQQLRQLEEAEDCYAQAMATMASIEDEINLLKNAEKTQSQFLTPLNFQLFQTNLALRDRFLILQQEALLSSLSDSTSSSSSHHLSFLLIAFEFGEKCLNFHRIIYPRGHPFLCLQQQTLLDILSQITSTSPLHKEKYEKLFKEVKEDKKSLFRK